MHGYPHSEPSLPRRSITIYVLCTGRVSWPFPEPLKSTPVSCFFFFVTFSEISKDGRNWSETPLEEGDLSGENHLPSLQVKNGSSFPSIICHLHSLQIIQNKQKVTKDPSLFSSLIQSSPLQEWIRSIMQKKYIYQEA